MRQAFTSDTRQEDGTRKWLRTFSQKETEFTSSTFRRQLRSSKKLICFVRDLSAEGGEVLFVGTKKQAGDSVKEEATRAGAHYVNARWLGGMLTNFKTIQTRIKRLEQLHTMEEDGTFALLPKKEVVKLNLEIEKLEKFLGGIKNMKKLPQLSLSLTPARKRSL